MGAPKGNQFWKLRSKHGRDRLFTTPELMLEAACEYFQWCDDNPFYEVEQKKGANNIRISKGADKDAVKGALESLSDTVSLPKMRPYTIQGLCLYLDCNIQYFNDFYNSIIGKTDQKSKDFSAIISRIKEIIYNQKFSGAAAGFFNPNIIARDLGLSEKTDVSFDSEKKLNISIDSKEIDLGK